MGIVSDHLRDRIAGQVREHRLVVWFDPEEHYCSFIEDLDLPDTTIARYEGSFFALRHAVDPLLNDEQPPRLVVYVGGVAEGDTHGALAELIAPGMIMAPGQNPPEANTRLSYVARMALLQRSEAWTAVGAEEIAQQIESGKICSLDEADRVAEKGGTSGVIQLIFGTGLPHEVALAFLGSTEYDRQIVAKKALSDLRDLLVAAYGCTLPDGAAPTEIRGLLAGHVLRTEFVASLQGPLPAALQHVKIAPPSSVVRDACVALARSWRDSYHLRESYAGWADHMEDELAVRNVAFAPRALDVCQTFAGLEARAQEALERELVAGTGSAEDATRQRAVVAWRLQDFWSAWPERYETVQARWRLIEAALELLSMAREIEIGLKSFDGGAAALVRRYAGGEDDERPWCLLDTYQRHLERRYHDFTLEARHESLEKLIARARQRYMDVGDTLGRRFVEELKAARFKVPGVQRQRDIYDESVAPALKAGKTAYVLVDALRFEMARELVRSFGRDVQVKLSYALAAVPTITEIGMASLMPRAPEGRVVSVGAGKLGLQIDGDTILKDRASRMSWLKEHVAGKVAVTTLDGLLPKPRKALDAELHEAQLIVVTSQEIDALCEGDNIHLARKVMGDVLVELAKAVARLRDYGCSRVIVAADHGYLFGDELESDMKIEPPGGRTDDLHRRVWVGSGGRADPAFMRAALADFGLSSDLEIAVPPGFAAFTVQGGARAYFHGGMSPQEIVVPVAVLTPVGAAVGASGQGIEWTIKPGSKKISTQFFSVLIEGTVDGLFAVEPPRVRVEVRVKNDNVAQTVAAAYGFVEATQEIELRMRAADAQQIEANHITLMIDPDAAGKGVTATVLLLDAATGLTLKSVGSVAVAIAL